MTQSSCYQTSFLLLGYCVLPQVTVFQIFCAFPEQLSLFDQSTVFISQTLWQQSIITCDCGWFKKIWRAYLFEASHCSPALLKVLIYFKELAAVIFIKKHCVKCTKVQPPRSLLMNVLICNFPTVHCMQSVQIRNFFWSVISCIRTKYGDLLRKKNGQEKLRIWILFRQW